MSDPINPNTLLPMSLQVDKMEQARQLHTAHEQSVLSQKKIKDDEKKNNKVNKNEESEYLLIDDRESENNSNQNENDAEEKRKKEGEKRNCSRGSYIDIRI